MSGSQERDASRLVRDLADTPGAVAVLVTLLERGGSASRQTLAAAGDIRDVDAVIGWLTAAGLVRGPDGSATFDLDRPDIPYELTTLGATLTRSLIDLAKVVSGPTTTRQR